MAEEKVKYRAIKYIRKDSLATMESGSISDEASKVIDQVKDNEPLILLISVTNPAYIEEALPFSKENMKRMVEIAEKKIC